MKITDNMVELAAMALANADREAGELDRWEHPPTPESASEAWRDMHRRRARTAPDTTPWHSLVPDERSWVTPVDRKVCDNMPVRVQLRRVKGWTKPAGTVVVARPSQWGNPYRVGMAATGGYRAARDRAEAVELFKRLVAASPTFVNFDPSRAGRPRPGVLVPAGWAVPRRCPAGRREQHRRRARRVGQPVMTPTSCSNAPLLLGSPQPNWPSRAVAPDRFGTGHR